MPARLESASMHELFLADAQFPAHIHLHVELAYIAHSERCALLLDAEGVCRWVVPKVDATDDLVTAARRCIGAQFLATLDRETPGYMGHEPRIGGNLLFALVTDGRVALVRFGPLLAFEELDRPNESVDLEVPTTSSDASETEADERVTMAPPAERDVDAEAPLPPTVVEAVDVDDLITLLAEEAPPSAEHLSGSALEEVLELDAPAPEAQVPTGQREEKPSAPEAQGVHPVDGDATPIAAEAGAKDLESRPIEPESITAPESIRAPDSITAPESITAPDSIRAPDSSGDLAIVTGSFARISVRELEVEEPSGLDALDALVARKGRASADAGEPVSPPAADSSARSPDRIVELTNVSATAPSGGRPDDVELDIITASFARSEQLAALFETAPDLVLDTGSFALASSRELDGEAAMPETEPGPFRPSGFVMRGAPGSTRDAASAADDERPIAPDDETRRFSRAAGDMQFIELELEVDSPRRGGMLPRR